MKLAVLRIRGRRKIHPKIDKTMKLLRLERPNHCVLIEDTPQNKGMLGIAKDYVAYGPVDEDTIYRLLLRKGRKGAAFLRTQMDDASMKKAAKEIFSGRKTAEYANPVFRLKPPSKGYKSIKKSYPEGDLGSRGDISALIRRMV